MTTVFVTGGNKGIGFEICRILATQHNCRVVLAARDRERGTQAAAAIGPNVTWCPLDVRDSASVARAADFVKTECNGSIDVLINNAGFAYKGNTFGAAEARETLDVNTVGLAAITAALRPYVKKRIVNVCSRAGRLQQVAPALQAAFTDERLSERGVLDLTSRFVDDVARGVHAQNGWGNSMYGISKLGAIALTRVQAREAASQGISVTACCPGYCVTDMTSRKGNKSAAEGADTPVWLAVGMDDHTAARASGRFFAERQEIQW